MPLESASSSAVPEFDSHATTYDAELNSALSVSGEEKEYFAQKRVAWLAGCLRKAKIAPRSAIDYGCGIGDTSDILRQTLHLQSLVGLEVSTRSIDIARQRNSSKNCRYLEPRQYTPEGMVDLAYCNGVFHHIPVAERLSAANYILRCLRPGGFFALWENNPWNPGTRYIMSRCEFDGDAVTLTPPESKHMLQTAGFEIVSVHYLFIFPRVLAALRPIEPYLARMPLGGQYQVLCRKPNS